MRSITKDAIFSPDRQYRYALSRVWDESTAKVLFISLNPSTADEYHDDPTVRRCIGYARSWGYGGLWVANLFAYRATDPRELKRISDPIGPENDSWLKELAQDADLIIAAWGNAGCYQGRDRVVRSMLGEIHCLGVNKSGQPSHPLYLRKDIQPRIHEG